MFFSLGPSLQAFEQYTALLDFLSNAQSRGSFPPRSNLCCYCFGCTALEAVAIFPPVKQPRSNRSDQIPIMIRRPLTEIILKLDDIQEYESLRRDQGSDSSLAGDMQEETPKSMGIGQKTTEEIHNRIGYAPKKKPSGPSTV